LIGDKGAITLSKGLFKPNESPIYKNNENGHSQSSLLSIRGGSSAGSNVVVPVYAIKILLQLCLTSLNVACWLIPMKLPQFTENKVAVSIANAFSGGVFLSLSFGHLLPEAVEAFEDYDSLKTVPYFLALTGYMLIFFVEKIAFDAHALIEHGPEHTHSGKGVKALPDTVYLCDTKGHAFPNKPAESSPLSSGRSAVILLLALSVHSLFETMAIGLCDTAWEASLLAMSIALHQPAESLALLVSFLKSGLPQKQVVFLLSMFSAVGSIGMLTGIVVNEFAGKIVDAILVALASGTFIYVGATEVIAEEFEDQENKWKKFGALIAGILLIACITTYTEGIASQGF